MWLPSELAKKVCDISFLGRVALSSPRFVIVKLFSSLITALRTMPFRKMRPVLCFPVYLGVALFVVEKGRRVNADCVKSDHCCGKYESFDSFA